MALLNFMRQMRSAKDALADAGALLADAPAPEANALEAKQAEQSAKGRQSVKQKREPSTGRSVCQRTAKREPNGSPEAKQAAEAL